MRQGGASLHPFVGIGFLAEFAVIRAAAVVKIDPDMPLDLIALAGCGVDDRPRRGVQHGASRAR